MQKIIDKHLLYVMGMLFLLSGEIETLSVFTMLIALIYTELGIYYGNKKMQIGLAILYMGTSLFCPMLVFFMPVVFYHLVEYHFLWGFCGVLLFFIHISVFNEPWKIVLWWMLFGLAILLAGRTKEQEKNKKALITLRDQTTEATIAMRSRNKELLERQDYEIHVATLQERNRIAREIHDNVGHMLSRSILQMGALMTIHKEEPLHGQLESINASLNDAMNNIRESVHDLHDESFDLKAAIMEATKEIKEQYQFIFDYDMSAGVPRNIKYCFLTIIKEAMANVVKHSNADRVTIIIREHPGFYQMSIEDNGTGTKKNPNPGIGLNNMTERVEALGGNIHFDTEKGFHILISVKKAEEIS